MASKAELQRVFASFDPWGIGLVPRRVLVHVLREHTAWEDEVVDRFISRACPVGSAEPSEDAVSYNQFCDYFFPNTSAPTVPAIGANAAAGSARDADRPTNAKTRLTLRRKSFECLPSSENFTLRGVSLNDLLSFFTTFCGEVNFEDEAKRTPVCLATTLAIECMKQKKGEAPNLYAVNRLFIKPMTEQLRVSMSELWKPDGLLIEVFISHFWGEDFGEFIQSTYRMALLRAAEMHPFLSVADMDSKAREMSFYICAFSNNQWKIDDELGDSILDSPFAKVLHAETTKVVFMNIDFCAVALSRAWCSYEFCLSQELKKPFALNSRFGPLHNLAIERRSDARMWLMHMFRLLLDVDVGSSQATSEKDRLQILQAFDAFEGTGITAGMHGKNALNFILKNLIATRVLPALVECGDADIVRAALANRADPEHSNHRRLRPLTLAVAREGRDGAMARLLSEAGADPRAMEAAAEVVAAFEGDVSSRRKALEIARETTQQRGKDTGEDITSFYAVALEVAETELQELDSRNILEAVAAGDIRRVRWLARHRKADVNFRDYDRRTALHLGAAEGHLEVVRCLVEEFEANVNPEEDRWGHTPLDEAVRASATEVQVYLENKKAVRGKEHFRWIKNASSDLCRAASSGDFERLELLLGSRGLSVNSGDYDGRTAMHLAASEGRLDVVRYLCEKFEADLNVPDRWGSTPFDEALREEHLEVASYIRENEGLPGQCSARYVSTLTCDAIAAAASGELARLQYLVKTRDVDVSRGDYDRRTPLHLAASEGRLETVKYLVEKLGASLTAQDRWGHTPADDAERQNQREVYEFLRGYDASSVS